MTRLIFIRHGESNATVERRIGGPVSCNGLSPLGRQQAEALAARLSATGEIVPDVIISSTYARAVETATIVAAAFDGIEVEQLYDVGEHFPGPEADGMTFADYVDRFGAFDWESDPYGAGFEGGETVASFQHRVGTAIMAIARRHQGRTVVIFCHGGVIDRAIRMFLRTPGTGSFQLQTLNTSITEFDQVSASEWSLRRYNDSAHLAGLPAETTRLRPELFSPAELRLVDVDQDNVADVERLRLWPPHQALVAPVSRSLIDARYGPDPASCLAAYVGDRLVGFAYVAHGPDGSELRSVLVSSLFQRAGYGRRMIELIADLVRGRGEDRLLVEWPAGANGPESFFLAVGFKPADGASPDAISAVLDLAP